ncbi:PH domain-containing protein [Candidatus Pacearchaeota archaeon]|nr:PH domain-containing protein [Candidatus Pacearchaeota archaeon]MBD3283568.1 PH domain-containing protein [Candidatus Pacearchaeota archaeon]
MKKRIQDDKNILKIRGSRKHYLPIYVMILILILIIIFLRFYNLNINYLVVIFAFIFMIVGIKGTEIHRFFSYYQITTHYLVHSRGILNNDVKRIFIPTISDIVLKQTFWQRLLNYGNVMVHRYTPGAIIEVKNINNPEKFIDILEDRLNKIGD